MAKEIERKFLLKNDEWRGYVSSINFNISDGARNHHKISQGYILNETEKSVRIRLDGSCGYLTIKNKGNGISRDEFEYKITVSDANELINNFCSIDKIEKRRYNVFYHNQNFEIDEFFGLNSGLVVAELELNSEDQEIIKPSWLGEEVTNDERYINARLLKEPYSSWTNEC